MRSEFSVATSLSLSHLQVISEADETGRQGCDGKGIDEVRGHYEENVNGTAGTLPFSHQVPPYTITNKHERYITLLPLYPPGIY